MAGLLLASSEYIPGKLLNKHPIVMHRNAPPSKNYSAQSISSAGVEGPHLGYSGSCATLPNFLRGSQGSLMTSSIGYLREMLFLWL